MKLAYTLNTPEVRTARPLAYHGDLDEAIPFLADLGYEGIELMMVDPSQVSLDRLERLITSAGLEVPCICTGEIPGQTGWSFTADEPAMRQAAIQRAKEIVDVAARWQCYVNLGRLRGRIGTLHDAETYRAFCRAAIHEVADYASRVGVCWVLEPVTSLIHNFISTTAEGIALVEELNHPYFRLMLDVFHQNIDDPSIYAGLVRARQVLKHVHVCDSNKWAPGMGHLDLREYVRVLSSIGYEGYLSAELFQEPDQDQAARATIDYMRRIM